MYDITSLAYHNVIKDFEDLTEQLKQQLKEDRDRPLDLSQDSGHKKIKFFSAQQPFMECSTSQVDCQSEKSL